MEKDKKQLIVATNSLHKFICHVEILGVHVFQIAPFMESQGTP